MTNNITLDQVATDVKFDFYHYYNDHDVDRTHEHIEPILNSRHNKYYTPEDFKSQIGIKCSHESLGCINLNCQSIGGHWTAFKQFLSELHREKFRFDIIGLTEIFKIPSNMTYNLMGYHSLEYKTRPDDDDGRGGIGLFINSNLNYTVREDLSTFIPHVCESLFIEINQRPLKPTIIGIVYRPNSLPRASIDKFTESIGLINDIISQENKMAIVMGDFNIDLLKYDSHQKTRLFVDNMYSQGFMPLINRPTRVTPTTATIIDHIYTNKLDLNIQSGIIINDVADHYATFYIQHKKLKSIPPKSIQIRKYTPENIKIFNSLLRAHNFNNIQDIIDPDEAYNKFLLDYTELFNIAFPLTNVKINRKNIKKEDWITTGIIISAKSKSKLLQKKIKNPTEQNVLAYKKFLTIYNRTIRAAKYAYYDKVLREHSSDSKRTWKILNESIQKRSTKSSLSKKYLVDGVETENPQIIAHEFNNYFANIGKHVNNSVPGTDKHYTEYLKDNHPQNFFMNPIAPEEIKQITQKMKPKTSSGFDNIQMKLVKATIENIKLPLAHIFNQSFAKGIVPRQMKIAKIVPIYKAGPKNLFSNYRPISLLPAFSKLLEKIVCNRLMNFLNKHKILFQHQYGFRKNHSTIHPIIHLLNYIAQSNDKVTKDQTLSIFLDLSKAFDTIPHSTLISKLEHYGIRGIANSWFKSYLNNRTQFMEFDAIKSSELKIECGVPQGSILGPILFILFINDLHTATKLNILSFADDTTVYTSGNNINEIILLANIELNKLYKWFCTNKLQLNAKKSKFAIFCPRQTRLPNIINEITINNQSITRIGKNCNEKSIKFLGVHLDENLTWNEHINYISKKISQSLFAMYRVKYALPLTALTSLYYALIHSHLNYAIQIWGNSNDMYKLITRQKRAIRLISNKPYLSHTEPLFKQKRILKVDDLYKTQIALFMHDLQNNKLPMSFNQFNAKRTRRYTIATRQTNTTHLTTDRARTAFTSKLPKHFFPKIWNDTDDHFKLAKSKKIAKKLLTNKFIDNYNENVLCNNTYCRYCP